MPAQRRLILASTSRYRRSLLDRLGLAYAAEAPHFEELPVPGLDPHATIAHFAREKARSLAHRFDDALILASDQGLVAGGKLWGKPSTFEAACAQLRELAGGTHELVTSVALLDTASGTLDLDTQVCTVRYRALGPAAIADYVRRDDPLDCAGCFKIESLGIALFERVDSDDPSGIMGLPLIRVARMLERRGLPLFPAG